MLVLSNSLGTDMWMWEGQLPVLTERFRVLRYDQRGHGRSPAPQGPYTIADLGGDLLELLDALGLERVSLSGVSLGGMTAIWVAANAPERVERLGLCCTSAHMPPRESWTERASLVRAKGTRAIVDVSLERWFTPEAAERRPEVVERAWRALLEADPEGYAGCCEAIGSLDLNPELRRVRAPTLVIAAEDDPATPPDHAVTIAAGIAGAELLVLEHGRHLAAVEYAEECAHALVGHLWSDTQIG